MNSSQAAILEIEFDPSRSRGIFRRTQHEAAAIWDRLQAKAIASGTNAIVGETAIEMPWPSALSVVREFGTKQQQEMLAFRFRPKGSAAEQLRRFAEEVRATREARSSVLATNFDISLELSKAGFTKRDLKDFQLRDISHLLSLPHGANFSVPGAGKTTVTFALHVLLMKAGQHLLVIGPKACFPAWKEIVNQCLEARSNEAQQQFVVLEGGSIDIERALRSGAQRFLVSYDLAVRNSDTIANYLARQPVHVVLDESHRMKAGFASQRGSFLLGIATLPIRRDILTGTPMPQGPTDIAAQLAFLWPGQELDIRISRGEEPSDVCSNLYVRTTKKELGIPPAKRHFIQVGMDEGHLALYSVVKRESLRQLTGVLSKKVGTQIDFVGARRSVMRLLQISSNPLLALQGMTRDIVGLESGIAQKVIDEGPSAKMRAVEEHVRELAGQGRKTLVWTIFTDTLLELERMLADLNPVTLYGAVPSGEDDDLTTREGRIKRFHVDASCKVLIANPAAAGEGISLHTICHDAIYVDRSYVSTHYLQSIDRIHRLGLPQDVQTNIYIYQTKAPAGVGSVDFSVSRRLARKIRGLQELLDDPDLNEVALDEEEADDPIDYSVDLQDLVDLVEELEGRSNSVDEERLDGFDS